MNEFDKMGPLRDDEQYSMAVTPFRAGEEIHYQIAALSKTPFLRQ
jgi:hypothetical protein